LSRRSFSSVLIVLVTVVYVVYFCVNCNIIPYTTGHDKEIFITHYIYSYLPKKAQSPVNTSAAAEIAKIAVDAEGPEKGNGTAIEYIAAADSHKLLHSPIAEEIVPDSGRQGDSRVLLSGNGAAKAISSLSIRDKLWLAKILGRCSMQELLRIKDMLQGGVTYEENLEMYRILRQRVTDDEQKKLDTLIEAYTQ